MQLKTKKSLVLIICLFLLYISWGSSFLAIKMGLEYFPGAMLSGLRMLVAGTLLFLYTLIRKEKICFTMQDLKQNAILGIFLILISSGFLAKGQESIPSGTAAMICGAIPIWMLVGNWLFWGEQRPSIRQFFGLFLGFGALIWLNLHLGIQGEISFAGLILVIASSLGWVYGSQISKKYKASCNYSLLRSSSFLMLIGGLETILFSLAIGERLSLETITYQGLLVFAYLVIMTSIVGYISYLWLLHNARAEVAISYEYVNPMIATYLGWIFAGETVDFIVITACLIMVSSVFLVVSRNKH